MVEVATIQVPRKAIGVAMMDALRNFKLVRKIETLPKTKAKNDAMPEKRNTNQK